MPRRLAVRFASRGVECAAYLHLPEEEAGPLPCVVMAHGFGGTQDGALAKTAADFADAGLAAFTFDYRGFGESDGAPRQVISLAGQREDWRSALAAVHARPEVDPARIGIWGSSLSGAHVVYVALAVPGVRAVVAQVPFNGFPSRRSGQDAGNALLMIREAMADWWRGKRNRPPLYIPVLGRPGEHAVIVEAEAEAIKTAMEGTTWRNTTAPRAILPMLFGYRPSRIASRLKMPILVCLARDDAHTPPRLARRIAEKAPHGDLRQYPGSHFAIYEEPLRTLVARDQISFFKLNLGGA